MFFDVIAQSLFSSVRAPFFDPRLGEVPHLIRDWIYNLAFIAYKRVTIIIGSDSSLPRGTKKVLNTLPAIVE